MASKNDRDVAKLLASAELARKQGDARAYTRLIGEASQLLVQDGRVREAVNLCCQAGDFATAAAHAEAGGDYEQAAKLFFRIGDLDRAASALIRAGHDVAAAELYERAGSIDRAAALYARQGDLLRAASCFERGGHFADAAHALVRTLRGDGHYKPVGQEAAEICRRAGVLYERAGDIDRAVAVLQAGSQLQFAGQILARAGRREDAIKYLATAGDFLAAAEIARQLGDERRASLLLAERARRAGRLLEAAQEFERAGDLIEAGRCYEYGLDLASAARVYRQAGRAEVAASLYEKAGDSRAAAECLGSQDLPSLEEPPDAPPIRLAQVAVLRARAGEPQKFVDAIQIASSIPPEDKDYVVAQTIVGTSLAAMGKRDEAMRVFHRLLEDARLSDVHLPPLYEYGRLLEIEGHLSRARTVYRTIQRLKPEYMDVDDRLLELGDSGIVPLERVRNQLVQRGLDPVALGLKPGGAHEAPVRVAMGRAVSPPSPSTIPRDVSWADTPTMSGYGSPSSGAVLPLAPTPAAAATGGSSPPAIMGAPVGASPSTSQSSPPASIEETLANRLDSMRPESFLGLVLRGRFRVEKHLGGGSQAQVFRARDVVLDRPVAIKVLNTTVAKSRAEIERFVAEARLTAKIQHPNSIAVYDFGQESGVVFMAMEFFEGRTLARLLEDEGRLEAGRVFKLALSMASGLAAAHKAGIIHRDVKPANVLIDSEDNIRITDYGVAMMVDEVKPSEASVAGTLKYMAPEQATGEVRDPRSDVYSLGVLLMEMLTGVAPFDGSVQALIARASSPPPELPSDVKLSEAGRALLRKCLEPLVENRPSMAAVIEGIASAR